MARRRAPTARGPRTLFDEPGAPTRRDAAPPRNLRVAGLFAGIGGLELGLAGAGHETRLLCELDGAAVAVLKARMPGPDLVGDICDLRELPRDVDLVAAGFPCQDLSQAGKTAGIDGTRSSLVGEVFRLLEQRRVPWVLLENVPFMLQLARGRALDVVLSGLERLGYRWAYRVVDTRWFGLPQRRERVFFVASLDADPRDVLLADDEGEVEEARPGVGVACGFYWTEGVRGLGWAVDAVPTLKGGSTIGIPSPPAILLPSGLVVKPDIRDAERLQGFEADWTRPAEQVARAGHRWKLVGNAVTVDVARWLGGRLARPGAFEQFVTEPLLPGRPWPRAAFNVGDGRRVARVSSAPVRRQGPGIAEFLHHEPHPLSAKATAGFLGRARSGSLRFPPGFLGAVEAHLERMQLAVPA